MTILKIIPPANPVLRQKAKKVKALTPKIQTLIDNMFETMYDSYGVGLAAPQVAQPLRMFVAYLAEDPLVEDGIEAEPAPGIGQELVMINPEIIHNSDVMALGNEGCLSIPGYQGTVERPDGITIKYLDRKGNKQRLTTHGWMARVLQHEYDHLDGVLFIDKALEIWELGAEDEDDLEDDA